MMSATHRNAIYMYRTESRTHESSSHPNRASLLSHVNLRNVTTFATMTTMWAVVWGRSAYDAIAQLAAMTTAAASITLKRRLNRSALLSTTT